jgi:hypothetical protein
MIQRAPGKRTTHGPVRRSWSAWLLAVSVAACGREAAPTAPAEQSFLAGTWRGTVTIQVNPQAPNPLPATSGPITWTFEVMPNTNRQSFNSSIRSEHAWLPITTAATTAISPGNSPPTQISTQGTFTSPRGCRGTFGSVGTAQATRIEADFTGTDCDAAVFAGQLVLTKQ